MKLTFRHNSMLNFIQVSFCFLLFLRLGGLGLGSVIGLGFKVRVRVRLRLGFVFRLLSMYVFFCILFIICIT